jgi:hypothetical protein
MTLINMVGFLLDAATSAYAVRSTASRADSANNT